MNFSMLLNEFQIQNHTRIINLLVSFSNPKLVRSKLDNLTSFAFGTLASFDIALTGTCVAE